MYFWRMFSFAKKKKVTVHVFNIAHSTSVCKILVRILYVMTNNTSVKGACKDVIYYSYFLQVLRCIVIECVVKCFLSRERSAVTFA